MTEVKNVSAIEVASDLSHTAVLIIANKQGVFEPTTEKKLSEVSEDYAIHLSGIVRDVSIGSYVYNNGLYALVAQNTHYGMDGNFEDKNYVNYGALANALKLAADDMRNGGVKNIAVPLNMGASRSGVDWYIVLEMIEYFFVDFNIIVCNNGI